MLACAKLRHKWSCLFSSEVTSLSVLWRYQKSRCWSGLEVRNKAACTAANNRLSEWNQTPRKLQPCQRERERETAIFLACLVMNIQTEKRKKISGGKTADVPMAKGKCDNQSV